MKQKRLQAIADLVDTKSIIDVGCDHALLCIYLTKKKIKCRGTDISDKVIKKAYENLVKYNMADKIELIVTNGIDGIDIMNTDTIVIAGMGTRTILDILKNYRLDNQLIISSNNNLEELRRNVVKKGYYIFDEQVIYEKKHYYVIIKFKKGRKKYSKYDYIFGPISKHDREYMNYTLNKYTNILNKLSGKHLLKKIKLKCYIKQIKKLIS